MRALWTAGKKATFRERKTRTKTWKVRYRRLGWPVRAHSACERVFVERSFDLMRTTRDNLEAE